MIDGVDAYPLQWPVHIPRTKYPQRAAFSTTMNNARMGIMHELGLMGVLPSEVVISTNMELRLDGMPRAARRAPEDAGVAVYFVRKGKQLCIPCDKWTRIDDNMQAIRKTIEALRGLERWTTAQVVNASFEGFQSLPAAATTGWWTTVGVARDAPEKEVERAFADKFKQHHPDAGGSAENFMFYRNEYETYKRDRKRS